MRIVAAREDLLAALRRLGDLVPTAAEARELVTLAGAAFPPLTAAAGLARAFGRLVASLPSRT
ncbi:MAG: hypothetical protein HYZ53_24710 [Planctomycetes bacterium]|nr:hypothetical protein [Planctomycetota bacterium]